MMNPKHFEELGALSRNCAEKIKVIRDEFSAKNHYIPDAIKRDYPELDFAAYYMDRAISNLEEASKALYEELDIITQQQQRKV